MRALCTQYGVPTRTSTEYQYLYSVLPSTCISILSIKSWDPLSYLACKRASAKGLGNPELELRERKRGTNQGMAFEPPGLLGLSFVCEPVHPQTTKRSTLLASCGSVRDTKAGAGGPTHRGPSTACAAWYVRVLMKVRVRSTVPVALLCGI